jgi:hypothetical protein
VTGALGYIPLSTGGGTLTGNITIQNTAPTIIMADTDNIGRSIHTNSNLIGFLSGIGNWTLYNDNSGNVWTPTYGWLHDRFARRDTALGQGGWRDDGTRTNCGNINCWQLFNSGYEVFDVGDGRHQVRLYGGYNVSWNCNCQCNC